MMMGELNACEEFTQVGWGILRCCKPKIEALVTKLDPLRPCQGASPSMSPDSGIRRWRLHLRLGGEGCWHHIRVRVRKVTEEWHH